MTQQSGSLKGIVVSAMSKVTDALIEVTELAKNQNADYVQKLAALKLRHFQTLEQLLPPESQAVLKQVLENDFQNLTEVLKGVWHLRSASERTVELISGHGEIWSAQFLNAHLLSLGLQSQWLDARKVLTVEHGETSVSVVWDKSKQDAQAWIKNNSIGEKCPYLVITGFVASTRDGVATTLQRNGSDYSASIFGALLEASEITIWTDVDGVLSADPRLVPDAVVLEDLSYKEATELAYFGAKVVHPSTMAPAIEKQIPIWIKNTFNPQARGSKIHTHSNSAAPVKGFATIENVALVNVEGTGMVGVPGVAQRLFGSLRDVGVSVIMISQASSEHSICFAIPLAHLDKAKKAVESTFAAELHAGVIQTIDTQSDCSILAAVGDNMAHRPGLAGQFLTAIGRAQVSVRAIAQGSSERNISVVVERAQATKALRAVHSGFFLSNYTLSIGIIGTGWVGKTLLKQLEQTTQKLRQDLKIDLRIRGIADSKKMILQEASLDLKNWEQGLKNSKVDLNLAQFAKHIQSEHLPHSVLIDCTASPEVAKMYESWLNAGIHVITPNKKANTQSWAQYQTLRDASLTQHRHYLYETTVGAGLPILNTLRELIRTGDQVLEVEGVLSGTLSFIFNTFSADKSFSSVVAEAKARGYTEPDPRDDLSGMDVARKLVILAREMGKKLELSDVQILPLLPAELNTGSVEDFLKKLPTYDQQMLHALTEAAAEGQVLRFVGRIDKEGKASVSLRKYAKEHSFARLGATDNIVAFKTARYTQALIVQGPGAGPEVTAAGVFADILRLSSYLGAPL